jgi:hypothetical protein
MEDTTYSDKANNNSDVDNRPFSSKINKRPNKGRLTRGHSIHPNEHTGISKQVIIPANQVKNIIWNRHKKAWVEYFSPIEEDEEEEEEEETSDMITSEIKGNVGTGIQYSRMVSKSRITPWKKQVIGPAVARQSRYTRRPRQSYLRHFKKRGGTHKHKRKNKHTRRQRLQRRRA